MTKIHTKNPVNTVIGIIGGAAGAIALNNNSKNKKEIDKVNKKADANKASIDANKVSIDANKVSIDANKVSIDANTNTLNDADNGLAKAHTKADANKEMININKGLIASNTEKTGITAEQATTIDANTSTAEINSKGRGSEVFNVAMENCVQINQTDNSELYPKTTSGWLWHSGEELFIVTTCNEYKNYPIDGILNKVDMMIATIYNKTNETFQTFDCTLYACDFRNNVGLLKINSDQVGDLTQTGFVLEDQVDRIETGEQCFMLGAFSNLMDNFSISSGIVRDNKHTNTGNECVLIDTVSSISGSWGSPFLNKDGKIVGMKQAVTGNKEKHNTLIPHTEGGHVPLLYYTDYSGFVNATEDPDLPVIKGNWLRFNVSGEDKIFSLDDFENGVYLEDFNVVVDGWQVADINGKHEVSHVQEDGWGDYNVYIDISEDIFSIVDKAGLGNNSITQFGILNQIKPGENVYSRNLTNFRANSGILGTSSFILDGVLKRLATEKNIISSFVFKGYSFYVWPETIATFILYENWYNMSPDVGNLLNGKKEMKFEVNGIDEKSYHYGGLYQSISGYSFNVLETNYSASDSDFIAMRVVYTPVESDPNYALLTNDDIIANNLEVSLSFGTYNSDSHAFSTFSQFITGENFKSIKLYGISYTDIKMDADGDPIDVDGNKIVVSYYGEDGIPYDGEGNKITLVEEGANSWKYTYIDYSKNGDWYKYEDYTDDWVSEDTYDDDDEDLPFGVRKKNMEKSFTDKKNKNKKHKLMTKNKIASKLSNKDKKFPFKLLKDLHKI
jgi:hypothetical protein